jgi:hypothetical protein
MLFNLGLFCALMTLIGAGGLIGLTWHARQHIRRRGALRFWRIGRLQVSWCIVRRVAQ